MKKTICLEMAQTKPIQPKFLPPIEVSSTTNKYVATASGNPFEAEEEDDIFSKRRMTLNIPNNYSGAFANLVVANDWLFCVLTSQGRYNLLRFFLRRAIPPGSKFDNEFQLHVFYMYAPISLQYFH